MGTEIMLGASILAQYSGHVRLQIFAYGLVFFISSLLIASDISLAEGLSLPFNCSSHQYAFIFVPHQALFRPYNARLTREAVASGGRTGRYGRRWVPARLLP